MEVRIVEEPKKVEKREVPFVVGGVYRDTTGDYWLLCKREDGELYVVNTLNDGWASNMPKSKAEMQTQLNRWTYVPGAYLAIPKTLD